MGERERESSSDAAAVHNLDLPLAKIAGEKFKFAQDQLIEKGSITRNEY